MTNWAGVAAATLALITCIATPIGTARAAAWTQPEGQGLFIANTTFTRASTIFRDRTVSALPEYRKLETTLSLDYGITEQLTLAVSSSLLATRTGGRFGDSYLGPGYTDLGARLRLWRDDSAVLSLQVLGRIPGATQERQPAQTGNTDPELDLRLLFGRGFTLSGAQAFVGLEAAYRLRFDDPPNEWRADLTFGIRPDPRWLLLAQSFTVVADGSGRGIYPWYWYSKLQISAVRDVAPGLSVYAGVVGTVFGENALRERGVLAGVWYRF